MMAGEAITQHWNKVGNDDFGVVDDANVVKLYAGRDRPHSYGCATCNGKRNNDQNQNPNSHELSPYGDQLQVIFGIKHDLDTLGGVGTFLHEYTAGMRPSRRLIPAVCPDPFSPRASAQRCDLPTRRKPLQASCRPAYIAT
jgi:hypothetical protein